MILAGTAAAHFEEFLHADTLSFEEKREVQPATFHLQADLLGQLIFAQLDLWSGVAISRKSDLWNGEIGALWGWDAEELRWHVAFGIPLSGTDERNLSHISLRTGIFHSPDFQTLSPWIGLALGQEWSVAAARFEAGLEGGVRLGEEFHHVEYSYGMKVEQLARVWLSFFFRGGI